MIIEHKIRYITVISVLIFSISFVTFFYNSTQYFSSTIKDTEESSVTDFLGLLFKSIFFQVEGAPDFVNGIFAFISIVLMVALAIIIVSWARELIGLT